MGFLLFFLIELPETTRAFPGAGVEEYLEAYGPPANLKSDVHEVLHGKKIQYYWAAAEVNSLTDGLKLKGNLIVLFEKGKSGLVSLQETILSEITEQEFHSVSDCLKEQWETVSKTTNQTESRNYDLYKMISKNRKYSAEMSYSNAIAYNTPFPPVGSAHIPRYNFWIHLVPAPLISAHPP
ncbi:MAG: hypothetical protein HY200_05595 [Nitrospirae bacterium]|nr:hypothetical protein [Nitrospirota bacterium]